MLCTDLFQACVAVVALFSTSAQIVLSYFLYHLRKEICLGTVVMSVNGLSVVLINIQAFGSMLQ